MSTFTRQFASADEYEEWLNHAGERISVLSITKPGGGAIYKPRQLWQPGARNPSEISGAASQQAGGEITVKYQTTDRTLAPTASKSSIVAQVAFVAVVFFALFIFAIMKL